MGQVFLDYIMSINLALSTIIFYLAARIYLMPKLKDLSAATLFVPILLLHTLRNLGLMFMASGAVYEGMFSSAKGVQDAALRVLLQERLVFMLPM